ncbi:ATP-binding protein [Aquitalea palustris]|nr:ATP-binding protein [Aquitalea palustris]
MMKLPLLRADKKARPGKASKASLATLFARYFIIAMAAELAIIIGFAFMLGKLYQNSDSENARRMLDGPASLLVQELERVPPAGREHALPQLTRHFSYPVKLITELPTDLDPESKQNFAAGKTYLDFDNNLLYIPLRDEHRMVLMGPLDATTNSNDSGWITEDIEVLLLWILFTGSTLGLLIYFYLRPMWRDLVSVRDAAELFANGDFHVRTPQAHSRLFAPLSTALNSMAARLERLLEMHQAMSHAVAHEIRTPIARLRFGLTMLEEEEDEAERQRYRDGMERDMQELEELITASMEYAKLNRGESILQREQVDLYDWFDDLLDLVNPLKPATLSLSMDCARGQATFDRKLIYVASRNLLLNAFKYAQHQVHLIVERHGNMLDIHVDDDGHGIPPQDWERIFEPFRRLDRSRDRATGGYGLGLSYVRLIAEHHGGNAFASKSPLGGARLTLRIALS